ncbi:MmcQ/YjbR family DNA-binding protein [Nocardia farcinica]|uniref:MmcQ/YjbR family DNA-binding protein n=1 Tax=Nocardia farcinica TaxID=37329 RepID=UPI000A364206|nr:MmcQ/YjbR family DNA-binding protein [Nocardia farcinica]MBA4856206.1 MmcQ/YjbR family DNA-binding protein [Nocardia farcinica]MBC9816413.1 MmcQ/YjbR family DNA-binding protein [Nocardia farcinica]
MTLTWQDVVTMATELPEVAESTWWRSPGLKVAGKGFARLRVEAEGGLALRCDLAEKHALLASGDPAFYTTPHYDGSPYILVDLGRVDEGRLRELLDAAWWLAAPAAARRRRERAADTA